MGINNEANFHVKNNQKLMIEVHKCVNGLSNSITNEISSKRNIEHNLRNYRKLASHRKQTSKYGLESANYEVSQLWQNVSMEIENSASLEIGQNIKEWTK